MADISGPTTAEKEQELSHTLLIELLAYQFASPVRWIETQDQIFTTPNDDETHPPVERLIEIGPSPTLSGMAERTLKAKYESYDQARGLARNILNYSKEGKEIYYTIDSAPEPVAEKETPAPASNAPAPASNAPVPAAAPAVAAPPAAAAASGPVAEIPDEPITALEVLHTIVAQKLKKSINEVPLSKGIKDLVNGKSTLQNEILGDLQKEFNTLPESSDSLPLSELGPLIQATFTTPQLGKASAPLVTRLISSKFPGGFTITSTRSYLSSRWGLGPGHQDSVLLLTLTNEPAARLNGEGEVKSWLDGIVTKYAAGKGISFASAGGGGGGGGGAVMDAEMVEKLMGGQKKMVGQQMELFARYLDKDLRSGDNLAVAEKEISAQLRAQLDLWQAEHGDFYASGIEPIFSTLKARVYDSSWNWVRQDAMGMFYDIIFGRLSVVSRDIVARCISVMNRASPTLLEFMQYHIDHCPAERGETYRLAKELGGMLIENCREVLESAPVYKDVMYPTAPHTIIDAKGNIVYSEIPRASVRKLEAYVKEMAQGGPITSYGSKRQVQSDLGRIYRIIKQQHKMSRSSKLQIKNLYAEVFRTLAINGEVTRSPNGNGHPKGEGLGKGFERSRKETIPFLHLKRKEESGDWEYSQKLTGLYLDCLEQAAKDGVTFENKNVLITGAGAGSIGAALMQGLISGGARVLVTTSRYSKEVTEFYQALYTKHGSKGSCLIVVPFNGGSAQDVKALVEYVYDSKAGLGWDLDHIIPFAAITEHGEIDSLDYSRSELAHRIMLTNLYKLLAEVKIQKAARGFDTRPAQVMLPLSANHGTFGNDGLYAESKIALETLFNRWYAENWGKYLSICGAIIGWTRGTGLMSRNNSVAEGLEKLGVRTFSQQEMAFNLLGLMSQTVVDLCQSAPVWADLNGGMQFIPNLKDMLTQMREQLTETSEIKKAVIKEAALEHNIVNGPEVEQLHKNYTIQPRANMRFEFPQAKSVDQLEHLAHLRGMVDLERVVVVTGFAEVGPYGNSRTRWEMEAYGEFSLEGSIELAWIMGLIKNFNGKLKNGNNYSGWVDAKSGEPVEDSHVKAKYEKYLLEHTGIRLIEPELFNGYDPNKKKILTEVVIDQDLDPFETSKESALEFKSQHGDKVEVFEIAETGEYTVRFKKGANLFIPKALRFDRLVAGQIPTGWDAKRYGIDEDIINQVDPITLFVLVSTVEALISSGITDPYEFYKYVHVSEVGNTSGSGVGGQSALRGMYKDRFMDKPVQNDILQESFINTMSAWVNMLLLSSTGPIKTPVGACATAVESVDIGVETILDGKAKIIIAGGYDDFQEEGSFEFGNMKATSNAVDEIAHGRTPKEMSRPTTTTRNGFMESQGAGIHILMQAKLALEMGVPIRGIIALTSTATDKEGRSVPAPGKGVLSVAREMPSKFPSPLLDIKYRKRQLDIRRKQIKEWTESEYLYLQDEVAAIKSSEPDIDTEAYMRDRAENIEREARRQSKIALNSWGNEFWKQDERIAPLRGALATWGLTVDDLGVASMHGTSTVANDKNESSIISGQLAHLGKSKGNVTLCVLQKYLTGHPKGGAAAWQLNGVLQILATGIVPGNKNADNVDSYLERYDNLLFPNRSLQTDGIRAASVTSFGFGQVGGQVIAVHPDYLFATLEPSDYLSYLNKRNSREMAAYRYMHRGMIDHTLVRTKDSPPYQTHEEEQVFLNPLARLKDDKYVFPDAESKFNKQTEQVVNTLVSVVGAGQAGGVGVDVETIKSINIENQTFLERNFTERELEYCFKAPSPQSSFSGTWSAKEAVFKSLGVKSEGGGAAMKEIEILRDTDGKPYVVFHGAAEEKALAAGVQAVKVAISHDDIQSVAVAVAQKI